MSTRINCASFWLDDREVLAFDFSVGSARSLGCYNGGEDNRRQAPKYVSPQEETALRFRKQLGSHP
jgi:hypothetical protein